MITVTHNLNFAALVIKTKEFNSSDYTLTSTKEYKEANHEVQDSIPCPSDNKNSKSNCVNLFM